MSIIFLGFFQCTVCDHTLVVEIDRGKISEPTVCPRDACKSRNSIRIIHNRGRFSDKQLCRMQETPGLFFAYKITFFP